MATNFSSFGAENKQNNVTDNGHRYRSDVITMRNNTDSGATELDERKQRETLLAEAYFNEPMVERRTLDDWRQLARVMDRLFFWFTLLALFCFFIVVFVIAWT